MENTVIFGLNLWESPIKDQVVDYFTKMMAGKGAVRETLHNTVNG